MLKGKQGEAGEVPSLTGRGNRREVMDGFNISIKVIGRVYFSCVEEGGFIFLFHLKFGDLTFWFINCLTCAQVH